MTDDGADTPPARPATAGERLRAAREARGLSVDEVAGRLRLRPHLVEALERDDPGALGTGPYGRGQLRNYARLVGVDEALVVPAAAAPASARPAATPRNAGLSRPSLAPRPRSRWPMRLLTLAVFAVVAVLAVMWAAGAYRGTPPPPPAPEPEAAAPDGAAPPAPPPPLPPAALRAPGTASPGSVTALPLPADTPQPSVAAAPGMAPPPSPPPLATVPGSGAAELVLAFSGPCWVEVRDSAGNRLLYRMARAGDRHALRGAAPFEVTVGSVRDVTLTYNGAPWPKPESLRAVQRLRIGG